MKIASFFVKINKWRTIFSKSLTELLFYYQNIPTLGMNQDGIKYTERFKLHGPIFLANTVLNNFLHKPVILESY